MRSTVVALMGTLAALAVGCSDVRATGGRSEGLADTDDDARDQAELATGSSALLPSMEEVASFGSNPAGLKMYRHVPEGVGANAPLVVALHGCSQSAADYSYAGWNELADSEKFYVVYAEQTKANNPARCFTWAGAYPGDPSVTRGNGENMSIKQMVDKMKSDYSIDPARVFVTGLSGGAGQTLVMLANWPDVFAAGAPIAGVPFHCAETAAGSILCLNPGVVRSPEEWADRVRAAVPDYKGKYPRVSIWQGTGDTIVNPANERQVAIQWAGVHHANEDQAAQSGILGATRSTWSDANGKVVVEMIAIDGMPHGAALDPTKGCGTAAPFMLDRGICSTRKIAEFFGIMSDHPAPAETDPTGASTASPATVPEPTRSSGNAGRGTSSGCSVGVAGVSDPNGCTSALVLAAFAGWRRRRRSRARSGAPR